MRDDFTTKTKEILAKRVGYFCSNPDCRMLTVGPNFDNDKHTSIGVAAHITAASSGGPRYNNKLSRDERCGIDNAIWLCYSCSSLVDKDTILYNEEKLRKWKNQAERKAGELLNKQLSSAEIQSENGEVPNSGYHQFIFNNQKFNVFIKGSEMFLEQEFEDGTTEYYTIDGSNHTSKIKHRYPLSEYSVEIESDMILTTTIESLPDEMTKETIYLKWDNVATIIRNKENKLVNYRIKKNACINSITKKISVLPPDFEKIE